MEEATTSNTENEETQYYVEEILDKRIRKGKTEYYLKWKGHNERYNSWEPLENLTCKKLLKKFEKRNKRKKRKINQTKLHER